MMIGIGATDELSLRVSVAALVRVLFVHPGDGTLMLALERKATRLEEDDRQFVDVKAQPFGGALRFHDLRLLQDLIGNFHFDSEASHDERDLRLFIRPSDWKAVRDFCLEHFKDADAAVFESDPRRELSEEFAESLKINLKSEQYIMKPLGTVIENEPSPTENIHARGYPTARLYRIFEARILDSALASALLMNSESWADQALSKVAFENLSGRANAVLALPFKEINAFYGSTPPAARNKPVFFRDHQLDETVAAVLEGVLVPKYRGL